MGGLDLLAVSLDEIYRISDIVSYA
jgi:hypothetical protein